jgi:hypothetical protein
MRFILSGRHLKQLRTMTDDAFEVCLEGSRIMHICSDYRHSFMKIPGLSNNVIDLIVKLSAHVLSSQNVTLIEGQPQIEQNVFIVFLLPPHK